MSGCGFGDLWWQIPAGIVLGAAAIGAGFGVLIRILAWIID